MCASARSFRGGAASVRRRTSSGADLRTWARLYQTPLWLTAAFLALLTLFALTPDPTRTSSGSDAAPTSEPTRGPGECVVCGIDQECDPGSGRCEFVKATPLPCVQGAEFDEKAGFCMPTGAPTAVPLPVVEVEEDDEPPEREQNRYPGGIDNDSRRPGRDRDDRGSNFPFDD